MKGRRQTASVRLSQPLLERLERLTERLKADPRRALVGPLRRSDVLREALIRGIEVLERETRQP